MSSCLILIGGFSINYFTKFMDAKPTGHSFKLDTVAKKTYEIDFTEIVLTSLKEKGYKTINGMVLEQGRQESRVTITIPEKDYKGEQTKETIAKVINRLAKENDIGSFRVFVKN